MKKQSETHRVTVKEHINQDNTTTTHQKVCERKASEGERTQLSENEPKILQYITELKRNGRTIETQRRNLDILTTLGKKADLTQPDEVKDVISNLTWKNNTKNYTAGIYNCFLKYLCEKWNLSLKWKKPKYTEDTGLPFIPMETELNALIASGNNTTATFLQTLKETGARHGELDKLEWQHIDTERKTIYITAEKGSNSRYLPISNKLIAMFNLIPKINNKVFQTGKHGRRSTFEALRKRTATKLNNPRLLQIHLHTFRHYKGTTEYHKTKDIIHVKTILGHKDIESTMVYITLENQLYQTETDEWTHIVTHSIEEEGKAINTGFTLVRSINETTAIYKKRK